MTYRPRATCKRCGVPRSAVGHISRRGNCLPCGIEAESENARQISAGAGPYHERRLLGMLDYVARLYGRIVSPDTLIGESGQVGAPAEKVNVV